MKHCTTSGCTGLTGALYTGADNWIRYCPVCGTAASAEPPRQPDQADLAAAAAHQARRNADYEKAEQGFLAAADKATDHSRQLFFLWQSLLCRYGVAYVAEALYPHDPARRANLFVPTFGRFPLPDCRIRETETYARLSRLMLAVDSGGLSRLIGELDELLREIDQCISDRKSRYDVFIAWHDRENSDACRTFAGKLNDELHHLHQFSFASFSALSHYTVAHYEPHIYAALATAKVMVIVVDDYDALGQKFLANEIRRFMGRKKRNSHLQLYFCGMRGHTGAVPAYMAGWQRHHEDCKNESVWYSHVALQIQNMLRDYHNAAKATGGNAVAEPAAGGPPLQPASPAASAQPEELVSIRFDLECGNWEEARHQANALRQKHPTCAQVYLCLLQAQYQLQTPEQLSGCTQPFEDTVPWKYALQYADLALKGRMKDWLTAAQALRTAGNTADPQPEAATDSTQPEAGASNPQPEQPAMAQPSTEQRQSASATSASISTGSKTNDRLTTPIATLQALNVDCKLEDSSVVITSGTRFNGSHLTLPRGVHRIGNSAFTRLLFGQKTLQSITLPNTLTSIGTYAFSSCKGLKKINIPGSVTTIGANAFLWCKSLEQISLPDSLETLSDSLFYGCSALRSIRLPAGLTAIGDSTFYECRQLASLTIPASVTYIGKGAFSYCHALTSIHIPGQVKTIGANCFYYCSKLKEVSISRGVIGIGASAFFNCSSLTHLTIPATVTNIAENAFTGCNPKLMVTVTRGSWAEGYCKRNKLPIIYA